MIFLAVSMGFLAESLRENNSDHAKEKEYIISLLQDWKEDTAMMNYAVKTACRLNIHEADTLLQMLNSKDPGVYANQIYYLTADSRRRFFHSFQDRTMVQLRNAGGLRLITNKNVKDSISLYYEKIKILDRFDDAIDNNNKILGSFLPLLFDNRCWADQFDDENNLVRTTIQLKLNPFTPQLINQIAFDIYHSRSFETQYLKRIKMLNDRMPAMFASIQKEYHLD